MFNKYNFIQRVNIYKPRFLTNRKNTFMLLRHDMPFRRMKKKSKLAENYRLNITGDVGLTLSRRLPT